MGAMTLSKTTLTITILIIMGLLATLSVDDTVEWLFTETPFHRSGFSPNVLFTEKAAIHLWDCSPNI